MSAPDFHFATNALFRYIHDTHGHPALVRYWRTLGTEYYAARIDAWRTGGTATVAADWQTYFAAEPGAEVKVHHDPRVVHLDILVCPAISHLRANAREIVPYFCEHCDHVCGAMAEAAGMTFTRSGGMGACQQQFSLPPNDPKVPPNDPKGAR